MDLLSAIAIEWFNFVTVLGNRKHEMGYQMPP